MNKFKKTVLFLFIQSRAIFLKMSCLLGHHPEVLNIKDSLLYILKHRVSISRYGDGELLLMEKYSIGFQQADPTLASRLEQVAKDPIPNHRVCIPGVFPSFFSSLSSINKEAIHFWEQFLFHGNGLSFFNKTFRSSPYLSTNISRFYMHLVNKDMASQYIDLWMKIFKDRKLLLVEGTGSKLGFYNDLFCGAAAIKRIVCPAENAFTHYQDILDTTLKHATDHLVLIALGPTATVLAYDLAKQGVQALDIGHIDIEYEWYKMGATEKVPVPWRYVNETGHRISDISSEPEYINQIIARVGIS